MQTTTKQCEITLNGEIVTVPNGLSLEGLLQQMQWSRRGLAVELNGQIVSHDQFASTTLDLGDRLEVVALAGGG